MFFILFYLNFFFLSVSRKFSCDKCPKMFQTKQGVFVHLKWCKNQRKQGITKPKPSYPCRICAKIFDNWKNKQNHEKTHPRKIKCKICSLEVQRGYMKHHIRKHKIAELFECDFCGESFKSKFIVNYHMRKHQSTRRYQCEICKQGYNKPEYLKEHLFSHSSDLRPFKCDLCPKMYCSRRAVIVHIKHLHMLKPKKTFKCDQCSRSFKSSSYYKEHLFAHSENPRPFKCAECQSAYKSKRALYQHMKLVHKF
jgi:uncharacterized Zn-finger protein